MKTTIYICGQCYAPQSVVLKPGDHDLICNQAECSGWLQKRGVGPFTRPEIAIIVLMLTDFFLLMAGKLS